MGLPVSGSSKVLMVKNRQKDSGLGTEGCVGAGSGFVLVVIRFCGFGLVGHGIDLAGVGGIGAPVIGQI